MSNLDIQNASTKEVIVMKVSLTRRLKTFTMDDTVENGIMPIAADNLCVFEKEYHAKSGSKKSGTKIRDARYIGGGFSEEDCLAGGYNRLGCKNYEIWNGAQPDKTTSLIIDIPIPSFVKSVRYGFLVDVSYIVSVSITPKGG